MRQVCDFCSAPDPEWIYHTRAPIEHTQAEPTYTGRHRHRRIARHWATETPEQGRPVEVRRDEFSTGWTACTGCAQLIELRDMERLITRLRRLHPATFAAHPRGILRDRFTPFFRTITGRTPTSNHGA